MIDIRDHRDIIVPLGMIAVLLIGMLSMAGR